MAEVAGSEGVDVVVNALVGAAGLRATLEALLGAHGELFFAPIGVEFPDTQEGVQPDIVFVAAGSHTTMSASAPTEILPLRG